MTNFFPLQKKLLTIIFVIFFINISFFYFQQLSFAKIKTDDKYSLLEPTLSTDNPTDSLINFLPLRREIKKIVSTYGDTFSLYFEYLPTGTSIRINSDQYFYANSVLKIPLVMTYYYYIERTKIDANENAIRLALDKSDITALRELAGQVNEQDSNQIFQGLDIDLYTGNDGALMTVASFSTILKALYFTAIINNEHSNTILNYLTRTDSNDMRFSGVPSTIRVAHSIGKSGDISYHDCGIVYLPDRPYILCMTSNSNEAQAQKRMKLISEKIFYFVSTVNTEKK